MRNKIIAIALTLIMLLSMAISTSAAVNVTDKFDEPTPGGDRIWGAERILKYEPHAEGFYNGINNGAVPSPKTGTPSTYHGVQFYLDEYKGEKCVRVELVDGKITGYFDVGYYSHIGTDYRRSLDATKYSWLRVRYAYNEAAADIDCMTTWARPDEPLAGGATIGAALKTWDIANGEGEWMDTVVYVGDLIFGDGTTWSENTIRQFRVQMFEYNEDPEAVCYIAGFGFFETEEEAKAFDFANAPAEMGADVDTSVKTVVTEAPTTEAPTEAVTEAPTEAKTEAPTEAKTEAPTEAKTEAPTEAKTEAPTEAKTEADTTEAATEADATEADTTAEDASKEDVTTADTEAKTEAPTEAKTEAPTEAKTEEKTEAPTTAAPAVEDAEGNNIVLPIAIAAAVIVIAAIVIVLLKKKK